MTYSTEHLVDALTKPIFVYRMASGDRRRNSGVETRQRNALADIERILKEHGWTQDQVIIDSLTDLQREIERGVIRDGL